MVTRFRKKTIFHKYDIKRENVVLSRQFINKRKKKYVVILDFKMVDACRKHNIYCERVNIIIYFSEIKIERYDRWMKLLLMFNL